MKSTNIGVDASVAWTIVRECPVCKGTGGLPRVGSFPPPSGNCPSCIKGVQRVDFKTPADLLALGATDALIAHVEERAKTGKLDALRDPFFSST